MKQLKFFGETMQLCRGFSDSQWLQLRQRLCTTDGTCRADEDAWQCAITVFERRIQERSVFYSALKAEFHEYMRELREPYNSELRLRFVKKMNDIVKEA